MSELQFTLFFIALLVGYVLLHLRLVRFEEYMKKLSGIPSIDDRLRVLDDRLRTLAESFDKVHLERVEARLDRLHEDLEDLREATTHVENAVVQMPIAPATVAGPEGTVAAVTESPRLRIAGIVENRLLQLGYRNLNILTDLSDVRLDRDFELQVECERGSMPVKGRVLIRNGSVRDVALQAVVQMFP